MELCSGCRGRARKRGGRRGQHHQAPPTGSRRSEDPNPLSFMTSTQVEHLVILCGLFTHSKKLVYTHQGEQIVCFLPSFKAQRIKSI